METRKYGKVVGSEDSSIAPSIMNASLLENESGIGDAKQFLSPIDKMIKMNSLEKTNPVMADLVKKGVLPLENVPLQQISPFGKTVGDMTYPVTDAELDIFSGGDPDAYLKSLKENVAEKNDAVTVELPKGRSLTYDEWLDKYKSNEDLSGSGNLIQDVGAGMGKNLNDLVNITKTIQGGYGNPDENFTLEELIAGMNATQPYNNPLLDAKGATPDVPPSAFNKFPMQFATNAGQMDNRNTRLLNDNRVKTGFSGKTAADVSSPLDNFGQNESEMNVMYRTNPDYKVHPSYGEAKGMNVNNFPGFGRTGLADIPYVGGVLDNMVGGVQTAAMAGGDLIYQGIQAAKDKDKSFSNVIPSAFEQAKGYALARFDPSIDTSSAKSMFDAAALLERQPSAEAIRIAKEKDAGTFIPRQTRPAKEAEAKKKVVEKVVKKVVKKATPKRVTVKYNQNKPVVTQKKQSRAGAGASKPKVTRTTGSRGGRGNVAARKKVEKKTQRIGGRYGL